MTGKFGLGIGLSDTTSTPFSDSSRLTLSAARSEAPESGSSSNRCTSSGARSPLPATTMGVRDVSLRSLDAQSMRMVSVAGISPTLAACSEGDPWRHAGVMPPETKPVTTS